MKSIIKSLEKRAEDSKVVKDELKIISKFKKEFIIVAPEAVDWGSETWILNTVTGLSQKFTGGETLTDSEPILFAVKKRFKYTSEPLDFEISERGHASILGSQFGGIIDIYNFDDKARYNANLITNAPKMLSSLLKIHEMLLNEYLSRDAYEMNVSTWAMFLETSRAIVEFKKGEND